MLVPFLIAMFLALTMGGSGTGPSFSVAYGTNIIRRAAIPGLFGIMVFLGALVGGQQTSDTLAREFLNPDLMSMAMVSIILSSVVVE